jgi:hypothetical protein
MTRNARDVLRMLAPPLLAVALAFLLVHPVDLETPPPPLGPGVSSAP